MFILMKSESRNRIDFISNSRSICT